MATWMVHLRIADKLLDCLEGIAQTHFIVGNIAPDSGLRRALQDRARAEGLPALRQELERREPAISFSKHAQSRALERGIEVTPTLMGQLADSVERAQAKGATNILAFDATRAFIINVPHGRVITTMSQEEMEENIFTNIDGAVLLK